MKESETILKNDFVHATRMSNGNLVTNFPLAHPGAEVSREMLIVALTSAINEIEAIKAQDIKVVDGVFEVMQSPERNAYVIVRVEGCVREEVDELPLSASMGDAAVLFAKYGITPKRARELGVHY